MMTTPLQTIDDLGQDVGRQDHRVLAGQRLDERADLGDLLGVEPDGRLVEDQHVRVGDQRLGQAHALAVALRQLPISRFRTSAIRQRSMHVGHPPLARRARHALDLGDEVEVRATRMSV